MGNFCQCNFTFPRKTGIFINFYTSIETGLSMSTKKIIFIGMTIGSIAGGYIPTLFGADSISFASLIGSAIGGVAGIWVGFKMTR